MTMRNLIAAVIAAGVMSIATIAAGAQPLPTKLLPGWRYPCSNCIYTWRGGAPYRNGGYVAPGTVRASCSGPACVRAKRRTR